MIKLLYKPTGNIFTIPDEEAIRIKKDDRGNDYIILDAGLQKEVKEVITQEKVKEIEQEKAKKAEEAAKEDLEIDSKQTSKVSKATKMPRKVYDVSELEKLPKKDLVLIAEKLGIRDMDNRRNEDIIKYITGEKKKVVKKTSGKPRKI